MRIVKSLPINIYQKEWSKTYKEKRRNYVKKYRLKHPEKIKEYYQKNRKKILEYSHNWYIKNKKKILEKQHENAIHKRSLAKLRYQLKKEEIKKQSRKYYHKTKNKNKLKRHIYNQKNKEHIQKRNKEYYKQNREKLILKQREYHKNNPRSGGGHLSLELQEVMNNVRRRDHNTCQWQGCRLTFREAPIHVHHIFPRSEYPELELIEQYMICYCANHHILFHQYRNDGYDISIKNIIKVHLGYR